MLRNLFGLFAGSSILGLELVWDFLVVWKTLKVQFWLIDLCSVAKHVCGECGFSDNHCFSFKII